MCGRFTLRTAARQIAEFFELMFELVEWDSPRFNMAPTQSVLAVRRVGAASWSTRVMRTKYPQACDGLPDRKSTQPTITTSIA